MTLTDASHFSPQYADWKAPRSDRAHLIWPDPDAIVRAIAETAHDFQHSTMTIGGLGLAAFRRLTREFVGHAADTPLILTGHQSELHHAGVWAKNIAIDAFARRLPGAVAMHLAVDTDAPKHLFLRLGDEHLPITDDPDLSRAKWTGLLRAPTPLHLSKIENAATKWSDEQTRLHGFAPVLDVVLAEMRRFALDGHEGVELPALLANAMHQLDWSMGLDYQLVMLSPVLLGTPWLGFVHHLLSDATNFSLHYNGALLAYRAANDIDTDTRPMPNLAIVGNSIEMPFWLDSLSTGRRERLRVVETPTGSKLTSPHDGDSLELIRGTPLEDASRQLQQFCRQHQLRIAPRALTLTCFMRLGIADLFVHGIGGGRYDQVLDRIFATYFKLAPPKFAVVTATLFHPAAAHRTRACVPCAVMEGHRLRHSVLGDDKFKLLYELEQAPRRSARRSALFQQMHRRLEERAATDPRISRWQQRLVKARADQDQDNFFFDREIFYAQQSRDRLEHLIQDIRGHVLHRPNGSVTA